MAKGKKGGAKPVLKNAGEAGSVKNLKKNLKRGGKGGWLKRIPDDGITIRFLTEPDKWFKFFEHYDEARENDRWQPCTEDCAYCEEGMNASKRHLANAYDTTDSRVIPLVLPTSLASTLLKKYDKFKTMMDRDYELSKEGTGFDTEYDLTWDNPKKLKGVDLAKLELLDLEQTVLNQLEGEEEDTDDDDKSKKKSKGGSKSSSKTKDKPKEKAKSGGKKGKGSKSKPEPKGGKSLKKPSKKK